MGQVWQATDTQLNREVALKILPDAFAEDPDRVARFQREAQVLASLNHPNIAQIHGIEEAEGTRVLELVEGPTLADRIAKGPIPVRLAMEGAFETTGNALPERVAAPRLQIWQRPVGVTLMVLGAAIVSGYAVWRLTPVARFVASTSPAAALVARAPGRNLAISPDGRRLAYLAAADGVYVRPIDRLDGASLVGELAAANSPFFSPDGDWLGFASVSDRTWKKVSVLGGAPVTLWDVTTRSCLRWTSASRGSAWGRRPAAPPIRSRRQTRPRAKSTTGGPSCSRAAARSCSRS